ncbi:MAG: DUF1840 family protein [Thiobacillaceae bacterium]
MIESAKAAAQSESKDIQNDDSNQQPVSLAHRALPLIEFLAAAPQSKTAM